MDVSVIICTWNNADQLQRTFDALCSLCLPEGLTWELVLVKNNCTDHTDEVVQAYRERLPLVPVSELVQGKSRALNTGVEAASGALIVFADDDVRPVPEWIEVYWSAYQEKPEGHYFGGRIESIFENAPREDDLLKKAPLSIKGLDWGPEARALGPYEMFIGPNWACPATYLARAGEFDLELGPNPEAGDYRVGEEMDLMRRLDKLGLTAWYLPRAKVEHFVPAFKCTRKYIAARIESGTYSWAMAHKEELRPRVLFGLPVRLYQKVFMAWVRWIAAQATGTGDAEYVEWRERIGYLRAFSEARATQQASPSR